MAAMTLGDVKTFLKDNNFDDSSAKAVRASVKIANMARRELALAGKWDFERLWTTSSLVWEAPYSDGTVSVTTDGTAVTGSSTVFTSAMVGRFLRFSAEQLTYKISAYSSATALTLGDTYRGSGGSGLAYVMRDELKALPSLFRSMGRPDLSLISAAGVVNPLRPMDLSNLKAMRQANISTGSQPLHYAVEWITVSGVPTPYLWLWPAPGQRCVLEMPYYAWPAEVSSDSDKFGLPNQVAENVLLEFVLAFSYREQRKMAEFTTQLAAAKDAAQNALAQFRVVEEGLQREEYDPSLDTGNAIRTLGRIAPGEPRYT